MTDKRETARLAAMAARLARPAAPRSPLGRLVALGGPPALLSALLAEIDETMLARRLSFVTDTGQTFRCDAYGRRLLAVDPAPVAPPFAALDEAGRADLRAALEAPLAGAQALYVDSLPLSEARDPTDFGLSAEGLAEAWGCEPPPPLPAPLDVLKPAAEAALAWLRLDGETETGRGGNDDRATRLADFAAARLAALRAEGSAGGPRCVVLGRQDGGGIMVVALDGAEALLLVVPPAALAGVAAAWRQAVG
jgi:hypothetical protein